jgi:hypothetical protein
MTKANFHLSVYSSNMGAIWPAEAKQNPNLDARIRESIFDDEDESSASFEISDIEDLAEIMKLYAGQPVRMRIAIEIKSDDFSVFASLGSNALGNYASFRALEKDDISPATAAEKLQAISHSLMNWERNNNKAKP